ILPELCRTHLGLLDARAEFEPGILVLLQCGALRRPALPGMQSREHDPKAPRPSMRNAAQAANAFRFCTSSLVDMVLSSSLPEPSVERGVNLFVLPLHVGNRLRRLLT